MKKQKQISFIKLYIDFLQLEIPNLLQIFTLVTLLSIFTDIFYWRIFFVVLIYSLTDIYIRKKFTTYLHSQFFDPFSDIYVNKVNFASQTKKWSSQMHWSGILTAFAFSIALSIISYLINPF